MMLRKFDDRSELITTHQQRIWKILSSVSLYTQGDIDVICSISIPVDFCRHLVGKTLINVCHCDSP